MGVFWLKEKHYIHLATKQSIGKEKYTLEWLADHRIPYDAITFTREKEFIHGHVILDDNVDVLTSYKTNGVARSIDLVCMSRPWNREWTGGKVFDMLAFETRVR